MKYQNKQNGVVADLIEMNDKTKMVIIQGPEKPISCTISTFKRWWKKMDDEVQEQKLVPMPGVEKLAELKEEVAGDGTPLAEVGKEIAEQAEEKVQEAKKAKKKETGKVKTKKEPTRPVFDSEELQSYIKDYVTSKKGEITKRVKKNGTEMHKVALKIGGHMFGTMSYSKYAVTVNVRPAVVDNAHKTIPGIFGARFIFNSDTQDVRKEVKSVLDKALADQITKNSKKSNKEEK